jgi:hypothetical protein
MKMMGIRGNMARAKVETLRMTAKKGKFKSQNSSGFQTGVMLVANKHGASAFSQMDRTVR